MGFSRQEYWSGWPFPPPGDLPDPGIEPTSHVSPALAGGFFTTVPPGKPVMYVNPSLPIPPTLLSPLGVHMFVLWVRKMPWRRKWQPIPELLPGESHGPRSLVGYSPWGCKESDTTEQLHFPFLFL